MVQAQSSMLNREPLCEKAIWFVQDVTPSFILKLGALRASIWPDHHPRAVPATLSEVLVLINSLSPFSTAVEFEDGVGILEALEGSA